LTPKPNNPESFRITNEPQVAIFSEMMEAYEDFYIVIIDGTRWVTNKKFVKHLRRNNVSEVSRSL